MPSFFRLFKQIETFDRLTHLSPNAVVNRLQDSETDFLFLKKIPFRSFLQPSRNPPELKARFHLTDYHLLPNKHSTVIFLENFQDKTRFHFHIHGLTTAVKAFQSHFVFRTYMQHKYDKQFVSDWLRENGHFPCYEETKALCRITKPNFRINFSRSWNEIGKTRKLTIDLIETSLQPIVRFNHLYGVIHFVVSKVYDWN